MCGTLMSGTRKTTALGTTLPSFGRMRRGTMARRQQCPIFARTLAPLLALPIAVVAIARCRSRGRGRPEDIIATEKTPLPPPSSTDIAARPPLPLKTRTAISTQPLQLPSKNRSHRHRRRHHCICCSHCRRPHPLSRYHRCCRCLRHRRRHHALSLASAVTIAAASANVTAPLTLLPMVGCCVVRRSSPAASSAVQICQPAPPLCSHQRRQRPLSPPSMTAIATATVNGDDHQKPAVVVCR